MKYIRYFEKEIDYLSSSKIYPQLSKIKDINESKVEIKLTDGIWVNDIYNDFYKPINWNKENNNNAVGIAVVNGENKFIIDKKNNVDKIVWGDLNNTVPNIVTSLFRKDAILDFNGKKNTMEIIKHLGKNKEYSALFCNEKKIRNNENGYLGSVGEWNIVYNNYNEINNALKMIGGEELRYKEYYWTSTQFSANDAWVITLLNGYVGGNDKAIKYVFTRPFYQINTNLQ